MAKYEEKSKGSMLQTIAAIILAVAIALGGVIGGWFAHENNVFGLANADTVQEAPNDDSTGEDPDGGTGGSTGEDPDGGTGGSAEEDPDGGTGGSAGEDPDGGTGGSAGEDPGGGTGGGSAGEDPDGGTGAGGATQTGYSITANYKDKTYGLLPDEPEIVVQDRAEEDETVTVQVTLPVAPDGYKFYVRQIAIHWRYESAPNSSNMIEAVLEPLSDRVIVGTFDMPDADVSVLVYIDYEHIDDDNNESEDRTEYTIQIEDEDPADHVDKWTVFDDYEITVQGTAHAGESVTVEAGERVTVTVELIGVEDVFEDSYVYRANAHSIHIYDADEVFTSSDQWIYGSIYPISEDGDTYQFEFTMPKCDVILGVSIGVLCTSS